MTTENKEDYVITIMMYGYYDFYPFHIFGTILMILFWIFVVFLIIRLLRGGRGYRRSGRWRDGPYDDSHPESRAIDILKERYAKGEITKGEFEQMKKDIE